MQCTSPHCTTLNYTSLTKKRLLTFFLVLILLSCHEEELIPIHSEMYTLLGMDFHTTIRPAPVICEVLSKWKK